MSLTVIRPEAQTFVCKDMPEPEEANFEDAEWVRFRADVEYDPEGTRNISKGTRVRLLYFAWTDGPNGRGTIPYCYVEAPWGEQLVKHPHSLLEVS